MSIAKTSGTPAHEIKFTALDLKAVEPDGAFEGYASLFGREDLGHDVIQSGAFADSLANRGAGGIKMLFQHDPHQPIGVWTQLKEDARGLYAKGRLMPEVAKAREVLALMRAGALDGLSIGFKAIKGRRDAKTGIRRLEKVDLWEISIVTFPMLDDARVSHVKGRAFAGTTEREFERWLMRDAGLTRAEAVAVSRLGWKGLQARRDAGGARSEAERLADRIRGAADLIRCNT